MKFRVLRDCQFFLFILLVGCAENSQEDLKSSYRSEGRREEVFVEYRGVVSLSGFDCPKTKPSSFVDRICYDKAHHYLVVELNGTYYHYCRFPKEDFEEWLDSDSLGSFYNGRVKGGFDCRLGGVPEAASPL